MGIEDLEIHIAPKTVFELMPGVPVTNSMITLWIVMAILIILAIILRVSMKYLPSGFQNFAE